MKRTVWTMFKSSFMMMGGDPYYPASTEVEPLEIRKVKGIEFFSFKTPNGHIKLSEASTGAIIADGFDDMLKAIKGCNKQFLLDQISDGIAQLDTCRLKKLSPDKFFSIYDK